MDDNDRIDALVGQWAQQRPDVDREAMALMARLSRAAELVNERTERLSQEYGVNKGDGDVVFALRRSGAPYRLSPTAIARALLMTTGTMTGRLDRLEKRGVIRRVPDPRDRRRLEIQLTDEGLRMADEAVTKHDANLREVARGLSDADRAELDRLTRAIITRLGGR
jgi:DNA-binding MarR family transcriptional regulator